MSIKPEYLQVSFACKTKEEAAYLIMSLRDMKYASLQNVSDLKGGGKGAAKTYGNGYADEAPPVEGDSDKELNPAGMSKSKFADQVIALSAEQQQTLKNAYGQIPPSGNSYDDLLNHENGRFDDSRIPALTEMLNYDPFAMVIFKDLLVADVEACGKKMDTTKSIFVWHIEDDMWNYVLEYGGLPEDLEGAKSLLNAILEAVGKSDSRSNSYEKVTALENLFRTSDYLDAERREYMEKTYCHYLGVEMGVEKEEKFPFLNKEKIVADGGFNTGDAAIDALTSLIPTTGETPPTEETEPPTEPDSEIEGDGLADLLDKNEDKVGMMIKLYLTIGTTSKSDVDELIEQYLLTGTTDNEGVDDWLDDYLRDGNLDEEFESLLASMRKGNTKPSGSSIVNEILATYIRTGKVANNAILERCLRICDPGESSNTESGKTETGKQETEKTETETTGTSTPSSPYADGRIHFTVILGYNEDLLNAELSRKGLNFADKIPELEVAE